MSASALILTTLEARIARTIFDVANAIWATTQIDEGIRLALGAYSQARPLHAVGTLTGTAGRTQALASLTGLLDIQEIWCPYTAGSPEFPPNERRFYLVENQSTWYAEISDGYEPSASDVLRVFYTLLHTCKDLDTAANTTWDARDDDLLVMGASGYALLQKSIDLNETPGNMSVSTPNYGTLGQMFLDRFDAALNAVEARGMRILPPYLAQLDERGR